ncbi:hypothetical protein N9J89_01715 [Bacteroidia bacterium]|nr:hypothetical protein [Bacteroidota bacterium]MDA9110948.1 hypothetical protein [Bacteroidia bacterium]
MWVGKKEFITAEYSNNEVPAVAAEETDKSPFADYNVSLILEQNDVSVKVMLRGVSVQSDSNNFDVVDFEVFERNSEGKWKS